MTQPQKQSEPFLEKKTGNKYEGKAFRPSIADLVKSISKNVDPTPDEVKKENVDHLVSDEIKKDVAIGLEQLPHLNQQTELLNQADPRNSREFFNEGYIKWARDNSNTHTNLASFGSRVSFWLGSTLVANPADKNLPDYVWYLPKDRLTVFRGHFHPKTIAMNDKYILHVNKLILEQRDSIQKRIAFWFLIFGLAFGGMAWTGTKVHNGYNYVVNQIKASGDQEKFEQEQKATAIETLKKDAEALVAKYKAGQITDSQFLEQKNALKARELEINKK